jgi:hypothetical protein
VKLNAGPPATASRTSVATGTGEIAPLGQELSQAGQGGLHLARPLDHRDQAEVAVPPGQSVVAGERAEDGDADVAGQCVAEQLFVAGAADAVEHHPGHLDPRIVPYEALHERGDGLAHG